MPAVSMQPTPYERGTMADDRPVRRKMRHLTWAILTGGYPPAPGGVSDYTGLVARGLAGAGDTVHVWTGPHPYPDPPEPRLQVHRLGDSFGLASLARLRRELRRLPSDARLLVQYVPHGFGWKAMNLPLCLWLASQRRHRLWVMFHEVAFPLCRRQPLKHNVLGCVTRVMAGLLHRSAERTLVSTPAWADLLLRMGPGPIEWLPVPSNLPGEVAPEQVAAARHRLAPDAGTVLLGHFGTFGSAVAPLVARVLPPLLLADRRRRAVLVGRQSAEFARGLEGTFPRIADQVVATGGVPGSEAAACLAACDVLLQPYPDGATTRRTTLMSGLALGRAVVSTTGRLTEPFWAESGAVALAPAEEPEPFIEQVELLLGSEERRLDLGEKGRGLYRERFSTERLIGALRGGDEGLS